MLYRSVSSLLQATRTTDIFSNIHNRSNEK
nr:MAG TPA: hypothetical protein [Caudoviricetes sp.]